MARETGFSAPRPNSWPRLPTPGSTWDTGFRRRFWRPRRGWGWVHSGAAGVGSSLSPAMLERDVLFTNSAGIHAAPMSETALAMIMYFTRGLDIAVRAQRAGQWSAPSYWAADAPVTELSGATVGIVGYGGIGREVARKAAALGSRVLAVRRTGGAVEGEEIRVLTGERGLSRVMSESDYVVLAVPETRETLGMINRQRLRSMKAGSVFINVARGRLVDEDALLDVLDSGHLRGAGLDVFREEPLPPGHPFYRSPQYADDAPCLGDDATLLGEGDRAYHREYRALCARRTAAQPGGQEGGLLSRGDAGR